MTIQRQQCGETDTHPETHTFRAGRVLGWFSIALSVYTNTTKQRPIEVQRLAIGHSANQQCKRGCNQLPSNINLSQLQKKRNITRILLPSFPRFFFFLPLSVAVSFDSCQHADDKDDSLENTTYLHYCQDVCQTCMLLATPTILYSLPGIYLADLHVQLREGMG